MSASLPELRCAICGAMIERPEDCFRASGEFLPDDDPLLPFCNAPMHWECYANWPERQRFARHHVNAWVQANRKNPFWWAVHKDEEVYVSVNPSRPIEEASVRLYALGNDIRVPLPRWSEWVLEAEHVTPGLHAFEREVLSAVLPTLRTRFPNDHAVVDAINPAEKRAGARRR
jgi:hypothetical protein